ncbi:MAG: hypothetical protein QOE90_1399 [Thermoplasmata archaeon]|jgi:hypothetical protein|nr:hypothetical protein [Thermoplasmata archaeon]
MSPLRCLLCGAVFDAAPPHVMQAQVATHQKAAAHAGIALGRVRS